MALAVTEENQVGNGGVDNTYDLFEQYYQHPWQDGYQFGDIFRTLGRMTSVFGALGGYDQWSDWVKQKVEEDKEPLFHYDGSDKINQNVDEDINPIIANSQSVNDARVYSNVQGSTVDEKLEWLVANDPENAQGWLEQLINLQAARENTQDARNYEKEFYGQRAQMLMKDLEAAGINPILASQYLTGSSSVGTAGVPDSNVSTNATSRYTTRLDNAVANNKTLAGIISALIAAVGLAAKGYISKR